MNLFFKSLCVLLLASLSITSYTKDMHKEKKHTGRVKYIQADTCTPGNGSKKHPFKTLKDAQDDEENWDTLIVRSSSLPLEGTLTLRDGRTLIGEEDPTGPIVSQTQPRISGGAILNSPNDGGIIAEGNVTIENILVTGCFYGIRYDKAQNLTVKNSRIEFCQYGLLGEMSSSGETSLDNLKINVCTDAGMVEFSKNPIHRNIKINRSSFLFAKTGIAVIAVIPDSEAIFEVDIKGCEFNELTKGITLDGAGTKIAHIRDSQFRILNDAISSNNHGTVTLHAHSCLFEGTNTAISLEDRGGHSDVLLENSTLVTIDFSALALRNAGEKGARNMQKVSVHNVDVRDAKGLFFVQNDTSSSDATSNTSLHITDSFFDAGNSKESFVLSIDARKQWKSLIVDISSSCFAGDPLGTTFFSTEAGNAGSAIIQAHGNSFVNFGTDISDSKAEIVYDISNNWWRHANDALCGTATPCTGPYQTCYRGFCLGPVVATPFSGTIAQPLDILKAPTICPHNCCKPLPNPELQP